jgi:DNA (cytosine-5)-methyltransferase 1
MRSKRKFISFFSGACGLDIGLEAAGLDCLAVNEIDPVACRTIRRNWPTRRVYETDIRQLSAEKLCADLEIRPKELFAIVGGPPCQAFSTAGRRLGLNDERGNVFLHFIDLIGALQPKYVIFENVRGLLSAPLVHRPHEQRREGFPKLSHYEMPGGALTHILKKLEDAGYSTTFTLYNTANFGVPQVRERLIFFASRDGEEIPYIAPSHDEKGLHGLPKWRTLRDAIGDIQGNAHHASKFPTSRLEYYELLKPGQNWRNLPPQLQEAAMGGSWLAGGGKTGFFRRLSWDRPSPTLVTRPNMKATDLCHPEQLRPLSVEEYAAIQTFPANYIFEGRLDDQYRQIGNAVPSHFGEMIGEHLIAFDEGRLGVERTSGKMSRYSGTDHASWKESVSRFDSQLSFESMAEAFDLRGT